MAKFRFDQTRCSFTGVRFILATTVVLVAQMTNNVVFLTSEIRDMFNKLAQLVFSFKIQYGPQAEPIIGIFDTLPHFDDLWLKENPDVSFIDLVSGSLYVNGKKREGVFLPQVKSGATVTVTLSSTSISVIRVENPGQSPEEGKFELSGINFDNVFVGALQTGRKSIQFDLINDVLTDLNPGKEPERDETKFDTFQGVIDISKDGKFLSRNSAQQGNGYALLNKVLREGIHRIKFNIESDFGASLCLGVARHPFGLSEQYIKDVMKHIYRHPGLILWRSYRGLLYFDGKELEKTTEALGWQHGGSVMIELIVNMEDRTIELLKNNVSVGVIFSDIPEVVQPIVTFYASYEKAVRLLSYESSKISPISKPVSNQHSLLPVETQFDLHTKSGLMSVTHDQMTVYREKNQAGNSICLLNITCDKNCLYKFCFVIENDQGASVCVGATDVRNSKDIRINGIGNVYSSPDIFVFRSFQGMLYNKGTELTKHLEEFWMTGTLLEMTIDVIGNKATIQFSINGIDQGIAFSNLSPPIRPLVAFYAGMEKRVTLIHSEAIPKAAPRTQQVLSSKLHTNLDSGPLTPAHPSKFPSVQPIPEKLNNFSDLKLSVHTDDTLSKLAPPEKLKINYKSLVIDPNYVCIDCKNPVDCVALPCEHRFLCAEHLSTRGNCSCGSHKHFTVWNLLV